MKMSTLQEILSNENQSSEALDTESENPELYLITGILANISHLLIVTNSAVNIIVYALKVKLGLSR